MNVYEMYEENDFQFGFFVVRDSWGNTLAKVLSIEGVIEGEPIPGIAPYFGGPTVTAEFYRAQDITECHKGNLVDVGELSCPGTFSYDLAENA